MLYKPIFELSIIHDYYQNQVCPDFSVEPTVECSKILCGHRLIIKNKVNGIVVIAPVDSENRPWINLADNLQFTFILKLKNKEFIDFTDSQDIVDFRPVYINCKPDDIDCIPVDNNIYQFSNSNKLSKIGESDLQRTTIKLSARKLPRGQNIFGIVNICNNSSMPNVLNQSSEYKITFKAKKQQWCYYLVTDSGTNGDEFEIADSTGEIEFILNSPEAEGKDPILSVLEQQFPGSKKYLFKSRNGIQCKEVGRKNIQLINKKKSEMYNPTVWIEHLPNPPNRNGIQVINALKYL